ncbi:DUF2339 domain-containing protein, partial [Pseudomonas aeruginosa]|uniref:DUF2339 domain-containing protein n=1 Tax=Pseudomonas aeruginosa TaxID=287 RepID=UPI0031B6F470
TVEHSLFPLELRLVATSLFAIALLVVGWRLRHKQLVYALIIQGGATGTLYLTVFGAFWLWQMLPMTLAFALLVAICAARDWRLCKKRSASRCWQVSVAIWHRCCFP